MIISQFHPFNPVFYMSGTFEDLLPMTAAKFIIVFDHYINTFPNLNKILVH